MKLLLELNKKYGTTLVVVTHDKEVASQTERIIHLFDGLVREEK